MAGYPILVDGSVAENDNRKYLVGGVILQRPSLVQIGSVVYAGFGGHCDLFNYTWVYRFGSWMYNSTDSPNSGTVLGVDITQKKVVTNFGTVTGPKIPLSVGLNEQDGGKGGIWQSGLGLASDGNRIFFTTVRSRSSHDQ